MEISKINSIFNVLEEVALKRIKEGNERDVIRISYVFMQQFIKEFIEYGHLAGKTSDYLEFKAILHGKEFKIEHRTYRDDGNDPDVDEEILRRIL